MAGPVDFAWLPHSDLAVEQIYRGRERGNAADDPLAKLLPVGNQGGFRYSGSPTRNAVRLVVLYTSGQNVDWPDELDPTTGTFTYYGDNRTPGRELHDTRRRGNLILRDAFNAAASGPEGRATVPPFLLFERAAAVGRDVRFRGLLVPGSPLVLADEQLVAVWRSRDGDRFQNPVYPRVEKDSDNFGRRHWRAGASGFIDVSDDVRSVAGAKPPAWLRTSAGSVCVRR